MLLISFELDEIFGLSDRILVMYEGKVTLETRPGSDERERARPRDDRRRVTREAEAAS